VRTEFLRHWYKPHFWRWWWEARASPERKRVLLALLCLLAGAGGFLAATRLSAQGAASADVTTLTAVRTVEVPVTAAAMIPADVPEGQAGNVQPLRRQVRYVMRTASVVITETVTSTSRDTVTGGRLTVTSTRLVPTVSTSTETVTLPASTQVETKRVVVANVVPKPTTVVRTSGKARTVTASALTTVTVPTTETETETTTASATTTTTVTQTTTTASTVTVFPAVPTVTVPSIVTIPAVVTVTTR
jgi:hypothetical protein